MRITAIIALCFACVTAEAIHHNIEKFSVHQKDYKFSTVFEMVSHGRPSGSVVKSSLRWLKPIRNTYDVYNEAGDWQATGISRVGCWGVVPRWTAWGSEFDVYDTAGELIGVIDGQVVTTESAKYSIYNGAGDRVGIAYLDGNCSGFDIVHPVKTTQIIARLTRNFVENEIDHWDVMIYDTEMINPAIIKVFAAFAVDYQGSFKVDN